jgi:heat shock protein HslJ
MDADDGTYLDRIDPLGGRWRLQRIGDADLAPFEGWIHFSAGGFLNHGAGCGGGHPAFYRLDGERLTITRREAVRIGKCGGGSAAQRAAAGDSERRLASFLDMAATWSRPDQRALIIGTRDGRRAVLTRPVEPYPELAGRWLIESIGGTRLVTERRPATLTIAMKHISAHADCNSMSGPFEISAPGRIAMPGSLMSTQMGCAPEDGAEDALMAKAISAATSYRVERDALIFAGGPGMVLRRPPKPDRSLAGQYQSCGDTMLGAYHEGPITLDIGEKTMTDNAGCTAAYRAEGPRLILRPDGGPACAAGAPPFVPGEPVGIGGPISTIAVARPDGFGFSDEGRLILRTGRGLLMMCRKGSPPPFGG